MSKSETALPEQAVVPNANKRAGRAVDPHKRSLLRQYLDNKYLVLLLLPGLIYFIIFKYVPMYGLLMSFQDYSVKLGVWGSEWVGLKHFEFLLTDPNFLMVLKNTIWISFLKILFGFPAPIILALIMNEIRAEKFKRLTQTLTYLPHFFSWVLIGGLITTILSPSTGIVNAIIKLFGGEPIYFLADKNWFVPILVITDIWKELGWGSIVYMAALAGLDSQVYEAAIMDGAGRWKQMLHITLPGIMPTVAVMLILRVGTVLDAGFDQIFNLYSPPVYDVSDIIDTYIYRMGLQNFKYSLSTAAGMFKSVIGLALVLLTNYLSNKFSGGEAGIW